ncbi:MAG: T9SS type A sorting domain-containing protein, partial [Bacteroidetes bacterium]|nr:T9SS type A sorting domain-containing protein [Bacteroidota bacterium]
ADSLQEGTTYLYDGGIQKIIMFSPFTNNDTMRVFSAYNGGLSVFSKQINQTTFLPNSSVPVNIDVVNACYVYNNKLYIGGMYLSQPCLLESTDGRTFTPVSGFNAGFFPQYSYINNITSYNNQLYYSINLSSNDFYIYRYDNSSHILVQSSGGYEYVRSMTTFKNMLFVSTGKNDMSVLSNIYVLDGPGNVDTSAKQFGYQDVDGNLLELITNSDSLYFVGNKGTFQASRSINNSLSTSRLQLIDRYINIAKLNSPIASFNYNNNQICLNANETFTSTSQNTDSLHWLYDGTYYSSSPGASAWMNIHFPTTGTHTVGLVAFGGNLTDTFNLFVTVYDMTISIAATRTLVCLASNVSGSSVLTQTVTGGIGAITYDWKQVYPPIISVGSGSSYTYTPGSWGSTYGFFVVATDIHGCSVASNTVNITTNPLWDIEVYAQSGSSPTITPVSGNVVLYKYEPYLGKFDSVTYLPTNSIGYTYFPSVDDGDYILQAIPSASSLQISYYGNNAVMWKDATPFTHTCANPTTNTINVIPLENIGTGSGQLSGNIYGVLGFGQRMANDEFKPLIPGTPIGGIVVKGGRNPGGQMFVQTTTDGNGQYTLSNIPTSATDDYFIMVDIPGLDTNGTYHRHITGSNTMITGLDFTIDSMYINPIDDIVTSVANASEILNNEIKLYPNPAKNNANLQFELISPATVKADLFDMLGRNVETIIPENNYVNGQYKKQINTSPLHSGIYFIKLKVNSSETVIKLIITN